MKCNKAVGFQMTQRLPNRHGAHIKGLRQFILMQALTGVGVAAQYLVVDGINNGILNIAIGDYNGSIGLRLGTMPNLRLCFDVRYHIECDKRVNEMAAKFIKILDASAIFEIRPQWWLAVQRSITFWLLYRSKRQLIRLDCLNK